MASDKLTELKQFLSNFISGPNIDSLLSTLADALQGQETLSIAVTDQLTISTAAEQYLDKRLAEIGITRPSELGMDDLAFKQMGIQINSARQIIESLHSILSTFYGDETVRAYTTSGQPAPYNLAEGDDFVFTLEDGVQRTMTISAATFTDVQNVTAEELSDVITRFVRDLGYNAYAQAYLNVDTGDKFVQMFGGAKGPTSLVQIVGGSLQNKLEFPTVRGTELPFNDTVWEITRNYGSRHRFRWVSGSKPALDQVLVGDNALIYGNQFASLGIQGTFTVVSVRPATSSPDTASGYFELDLTDYNVLTPSIPDINPPPNTISTTYAYTVTQSAFDDLKFFLPKKNTPYSQRRYALAWEPADALLRIYMPATTKVVRRDIAGAAHIHLLYNDTDFDGSFGSATVEDSKIRILSDRSLRYRQSGNDNLSYGGTLMVGINTFNIEYIFRENGFTQVFLTEPHGLTGTADPSGNIISTAVVSVETIAPQDDPDNSFLGPYVIDPAAPYALTDTIAVIRDKITAGQSKNIITVAGNLPNEQGILLFDLNKDTQEGPVKYFSAQSSSTAQSVNLLTISQLGTNVTVTTIGAHGAIPGQQIHIVGTVHFDGIWTVGSVSSDSILSFTKTPAGTFFETVGTLTPVLSSAVSTVVLDPSHVFEFTHEIGTDVTLLSGDRAYEPSPDGSDFGFYITGTSEGRIFAEELMTEITALGIKLEIIVVYPNDTGFGNQGGSVDPAFPPVSDKTYIWGS